jgi:RNA ligase
MRGWELLKRAGWDSLATDCTYMFEIIYPENRIVVDYGAVEKLVLLGVIYSENGLEVPRRVLEEHYGTYFELVKGYNLTESWEHLKSQNEPNREGYVLLYPNGFRVKVKFEEYKRLHHIITGVSNVHIWECLRDNIPLAQILENVPDEFYDWVRKVESELRENHANILWDAHEDFERLTRRLGTAERKEYALAIVDHPLKSLIYRFLDKRPADDIAWKMVKPKWSKPFFQVTENC